MDGVIKAYKEVWFYLCKNPVANFGCLLLFMLCFQYIPLVIYHGFCLDVGFPDAFWTGFKSACRIWFLFALIPAIAGIGG